MIEAGIGSGRHSVKRRLLKTGEELRYLGFELETMSDYWRARYNIKALFTVSGAVNYLKPLSPLRV
jgi:hypothetical protein